MKAATTSAVTGATRRASLRARIRTAPAVFRAMNVAPCSTHSDTSVMPTKIAYGWNRSQKLPVYSWSAPIGRPCSRSPSAMPITSGASRLAR